MDADKLNKLEKQLNNDTPILGDRLRQQAAKQLADVLTPESVKLLAKALNFNKDKNLQKIITDALKKIKIQDKTCIDAVCEVWAENRDTELGKLIKAKGWTASKPIGLKILIALMTDWKGIIDQQDTSIVAPLLQLIEDESPEISGRAKDWALSLNNALLQQEVCRLASEENNTKALEIANQAAYQPEDPSQAALYYFITEQWKKYQEVDPEQELLETIYYSASPELKQRIDDKGHNRKRFEWVWVVLGGKQGRRIASLGDSDWEKIISILTSGKSWQEMFALCQIAPAVWTIIMFEKLQKNKWISKEPEERLLYNNFVELVKKCPKQPSKGKLVRCVHTLEGHTSNIESLIINTDGNLLISAGDDLIRLWNLNNGKLVTTLKGHLKPVNSLIVSQDGKLLASGSRDKTVCMWRLPEGNLLQNFAANITSVWSLAMSGDGGLLASGSYQEVRIWQYPSGKLLNTLKGHKREVNCLIFSSNGNLLASGGGSKDNTVRLWQMPTGQLVKVLEGHNEAILKLAITPDNTLLASASKDNTVKLWNLPKGEEIVTLQGHTGAVWDLAISSDSGLLATASDDHTVKLWKLPQGKLLATLEGHTDAVWSVSISQDGQLLTTGSKDNTVRLWRLPDGENVGILTGHSQPIKCMGITPNGQMLVSGSNDQTLRLWQWDLARLCSMPIQLLTEEDQAWITEALENTDITNEERNWLIFLNELIYNYKQRV